MRVCRSNITCNQKYFLSLQINKEVLYEKLNGKLILTLNRPEKLNTLTLSMVNELHKHLKVFLNRFYNLKKNVYIIKA